MNESKNMPKDGQFVAIWEVGDVVFSQTFLYVDSALMAYDFTCDDWDYEHGYDREFLESRKGITFFQVEGE